MKERPILFSWPMVRATLEGRKTQTRQVIDPRGWKPGKFGWNGDVHDFSMLNSSLYGHPGDRLWVREGWRFVDCEFDGARWSAQYDYRAGYNTSLNARHFFEGTDPYIKLGWRSCIHMPREASRISLEITSVRVERLQSIFWFDALNEGVVEVMGDRDNTNPTCRGYVGREDGLKFGIRATPRDAYHDLWDSINAKRGLGWDANPWVWVVDFKMVTA